MKKLVSGIMLTLLLTSMLTLAFNTQPVKAYGPIYIRAHGSVDPPTAPIQRNGDIYTLTGNIFPGGPCHGIIIQRNNMTLNGAGYTVQGAGDSASSEGICLWGSPPLSNITVKNVKIEAFGYGIEFHGSSSNSVVGNIITNNRYGMDLSSNNSIVGNDIIDNLEGGIYLSSSSSYNTITGNTFINDGLSVNDLSYGNMVEGNVVNGKPLVYLEGVSSYTVGDAGQVILINCDGIRVENLNLLRGSDGLVLCGTNNSKMANNNILNNRQGITLRYSYNNSISGNSIASNYEGISLVYSSNNSILGNDISVNDFSGIILTESSNNVLRNNNMANNRYNFGVWSFYSGLSGFMNDVDASNTVDGKPVYYWANKRDTVVPVDAGYVALVNCTRISVKNLDLTNNYFGMQLASTTNSTVTQNNIANNAGGVSLAYSSNNSISGNNIAHNWDGMWVYSSNYNSISGNNITSSFGDGIIIWGMWGEFSSSQYNSISGNNITNNNEGMFLDLVFAQHNIVYHNNFINNTFQVYTLAPPSANVWDDGYPSGGNYWGDYTDIDANGDGIWDHPYVIDAYNQDRYPLVNPWTPIPPNQPPNCIVRLQKDGIEITEIGVEQFFDIYVGASSDDTGISQVRFSNDDVRDGRPTGRWTEWYEWDISSDDWDATTKIRRWAFYTPGYKEIWAELKDTKSQTGSGSASIYAPAPAMPVLTTPLTITPAKDMYLVGDSLSAGFTIKNIGETPITLDVLTVGGRVNGRIVDGYPDFTHRQVTLQPGVPYEYTGSLVLDQTGSYRFFIAFYIANPTSEEKKLLDQNNWNTCVELGEGLSQTDRVKNTIVFEEGTLPEDVSQLRDMINRLKRQSVWIPDNLLGVDSFTEQVATIWAGWTAWATQTDLTEKYYELYYAGLDYYRLRLNALVSAGSFLDHGDLDSAKRYVTKSRTYEKLAHMSFAGSIEVFDGNIQAGQILAEGIKDGCEAAATFGIEVTWPAAAPAVDAVYMGFDFAINTWIEGVDQATIDLATELVVKAIFQNVQFTSLDGTLENYVNRVGTSTPLDSLLGNEEFMTEFGNELKTVIEDRIINQGIITISEYTLEKIVNAAIQDFRSHGNSQKIDVQSPVDLRVVDSIGQVTGLVNGRLKQDIPMSMYYDETVTIFSPSDICTYEVVGKDNGVYGLIINLTDDGNTTTFNATRIPISLSELHVYTVDWGNVTSGEGVTIKVDSDGDGIFEYNFTSDNELNRTEYVAATTQHDIEITGITTSKSVTGQGYNLLINATIMNYGVYTEVFNVTSYVNTTLIASQTIVLASGNFTTITFTWNTTGFAKGNYTLWSYAEPVQGETFTSDNNSTDGWVTVTILGDVNGDFKCDGKDIAILAKAYGSLVGQAGYVPNADVNDDGKIDGKDIAVAAKYYGTHYP